MFRPMRRFKQQTTDDACRDALRRAKRGVLAVSGDDGYPYAVPLDFVFDGDAGVIYVHSALAGHKMDAIARCDKVCFTAWVEDSLDEDGWSYHLTSVVAFGRAAVVTDEAERALRLRQLGEKYFPPTYDIDKDLKNNMPRAALIAITVEHMTGKRVHEQ